MIPRETLQELVRLRDRVAYLEAELALARDEGGRDIERIMSAFRVTHTQARVLLHMTRNGVLTREQAMGLDLHRVSDCDPTALNSQIKHLRRRLPQLEIITHYNLGYELSPASRAVVRKAMGGKA